MKGSGLTPFVLFDKKLAPGASSNRGLVTGSGTAGRGDGIYAGKRCFFPGEHRFALQGKDQSVLASEGCSYSWCGGIENNSY